VGRYEVYTRIASGGMAAVYLGRLVGPAGFSRVVAVKRLHAQYAQDSDFVSMFLDEARIAARIRHPNVVPTLDIVVEQGELFLVLEYVEGESLSALIRKSTDRGERIPIPIVLAVFIHVLQGLDAAHEATDDAGRPLGIVHRDVSPQNVIVGTDGVARVLDFGVAKAAGRVHHTKSGAAKGKIAYMAPEQIVMRDPLTRTVDIYATSVMLWEALVGRRYLESESDAQMLHCILYESVPAPTSAVPDLPPAFDAIVSRGVERVASLRFATAREMAFALAHVGPMATPMEVADWVRATAGDALARRAAHVAEMAADFQTTLLLPSWPPSRPAAGVGSASVGVGGSQPPPASQGGSVSATVDLAQWAGAAADVFERGAAKARELDHPPPDGLDDMTIVDAAQHTVILPIPPALADRPAAVGAVAAVASVPAMSRGAPVGPIPVPAARLSISPSTTAIPWRRGRGLRAALVAGVLIALVALLSVVAFLVSPSEPLSPAKAASPQPLQPTASAPPPPLTTPAPALSVDEVHSSPPPSGRPSPPAVPTALAPRPRPTTGGAGAEPKPPSTKAALVSHDGLFDR
jgi:serine/threonine-protein kinase